MNDSFSLSHDIYIDCLKREVERRIGFAPEFLPDFEKLRDALCESSPETLSLSTLKRLWGYVEGWQSPRIGTLDILARYVGQPDYRHFVEKCDIDNPAQSRFLTEDVLSVHHLEPGAELELTWLPGRKVRVRYEGDFCFEVVENHASKLQTGYRLRCTLLGQGHPLYADVSVPGERESRPYLAGKESGINFRLL